MILVDYNGIAFGALTANGYVSAPNLVKHLILNILRIYNKKHKHQYGEMIICLDGKSWRRDVFPQYKYKRRERKKADSNVDWNALFEILGDCSKDLNEHFPYTVLSHPNAEADDIIAAMVKRYADKEPILILSADKDFAQLQKYKNVKQFSPAIKKQIVEKNPERFLFEHICRGDSSDGVPNILSPDNTFVDEIRQSPIRATKLESWYNDRAMLASTLSVEEFRNFERNRLLIDLENTPENITAEILQQYENRPEKNRSKIFPYLLKHQMRELIKNIKDF